MYVISEEEPRKLLSPKVLSELENNTNQQRPPQRSLLSTHQGDNTSNGTVNSNRSPSNWKASRTKPPINKEVYSGITDQSATRNRGFSSINEMRSMRNEIRNNPRSAHGSNRNVVHTSSQESSSKIQQQRTISRQKYKDQASREKENAPPPRSNGEKPLISGTSTNTNINNNTNPKNDHHTAKAVLSNGDSVRGRHEKNVHETTVSRYSSNTADNIMTKTPRMDQHGKEIDNTNNNNILIERPQSRGFNPLNSPLDDGNERKGYDSLLDGTTVNNDDKHVSKCNMITCDDNDDNDDDDNDDDDDDEELLSLVSKSKSATWQSNPPFIFLLEINDHR